MCTKANAKIALPMQRPKNNNKSGGRTSSSSCSRRGGVGQAQLCSALEESRRRRGKKPWLRLAQRRRQTLRSGEGKGMHGSAPRTRNATHTNRADDAQYAVNGGGTWGSAAVEGVGKQGRSRRRRHPTTQKQWTGTKMQSKWNVHNTHAHTHAHANSEASTRT